MRFFIIKAGLIFIKLKQVFIKVLILNNFDMKYHIYIKTNISRYIIGGILN